MLFRSHIQFKIKVNTFCLDNNKSATLKCRRFQQFFFALRCFKEGYNLMYICTLRGSTRLTGFPAEINIPYGQSYKISILNALCSQDAFA